MQVHFVAFWVLSLSNLNAVAFVVVVHLDSFLNLKISYMAMPPGLCETRLLSCCCSHFSLPLLKSKAIPILS